MSTRIVSLGGGTGGTPTAKGLVAGATIRQQVAPDLFAGFAPAAFPATSLPALALAAAAYERDPATGEQVSALDVHRGAGGHLRITPDPAGFEQFATSCFA